MPENIKKPSREFTFTALRHFTRYGCTWLIWREGRLWHSYRKAGRHGIRVMKRHALDGEYVDGC